MEIGKAAAPPQPLGEALRTLPYTAVWRKAKELHLEIPETSTAFHLERPPLSLPRTMSYPYPCTHGTHTLYSPPPFLSYPKTLSTVFPTEPFPLQGVAQPYPFFLGIPGIPPFHTTKPKCSTASS